ncbi:hypothetical protein DVH24_040572 [Malus domestica]|uniref:Uncharacterized protein n=1 Tax=Malus domestica TaxID=3750 RepID=A0A498IBR1_MALDO|nr:hypothetical protein DVH24_040572 [Malus domestica]
MGPDLNSNTLWTNLKNTRIRKSQIRYARRRNWRFEVADCEIEDGGELGWGVFFGFSAGRGTPACLVTTVTPVTRELDGADISLWVTSRASGEVT